MWIWQHWLHRKKWGVLFQNSISPKIQNWENCKNVVNSILLYLERSVMIRWKVVLQNEDSHYHHIFWPRLPLERGSVMWKDIAFLSEYCILMQCGCIYRFQMWIKMQHRVFKISKNEENVINRANLQSLWNTPLSSHRTDHKDRGLTGLIMISSQLAKKGSATVSKRKRMLLFLIQW